MIARALGATEFGLYLNLPFREVEQGTGDLTAGSWLKVKKVERKGASLPFLNGELTLYSSVLTLTECGIS